VAVARPRPPIVKGNVHDLTMQTATSEAESKSRDLSICVHHDTLRAPCPKGRGQAFLFRDLLVCLVPWSKRGCECRTPTFAVVQWGGVVAALNQPPFQSSNTPG